MVKGLFIPADDDQPVEVREFTKLEDYQHAVGGWIEAVDVPPLGATLYVNEEGLLRKLPFNPRATFLWWYKLPHVRHRAMLVGDVVVVGLPDVDGETTSLPTATSELLTRPGSFGIELLIDKPRRWAKHPVQYSSYFEAVVWARILADQAAGVEDVRVVNADSPGEVL